MVPSKSLISMQDSSFIILLTPIKVLSLLSWNYIHLDVISDLKISNNNKYFISGAWDRSIKVFSLQTMTEIYCFPDVTLTSKFTLLLNLTPLLDRITSLDLSNDDNEIIFTTDDGIIRVIHIPFNSVKMFFGELYSFFKF